MLGVNALAISLAYDRLALILNSLRIFPVQMPNNQINIKNKYKILKFIA